MMAYQKRLLSNMLVCIMKVWQILQILIAVKKVVPIEKLRHRL